MTPLQPPRAGLCVSTRLSRRWEGARGRGRAKVWGQHSASEAAPLMLSVTPAAQVIAKLIQAPAAAAVAR